MITTSLKFEDLSIGQFVEINKIVTLNDVERFAEVSGDYNPIHLDASYAAASQFKERIVHGVLIVAYVSALIGMELPGSGSLVMSLKCEFKRPIKLDDAVTIRVEVKTLEPRRAIATLSCICITNTKKIALRGEAVVMVPRRVTEN
ncbi:MaoC family dehydratase [Candidatus Nomurabacteria bacterium]|nr:MaoC family dehydratase [Candidatus Nomurabacteria bacterium]